MLDTQTPPQLESGHNKVLPVLYQGGQTTDLCCRCGAESSYCVTVVQYTPNLQDDSDANSDDQAGRMIRMERGCSNNDNQVRKRKVRTKKYRKAGICRTRGMPK